MGYLIRIIACLLLAISITAQTSLEPGRQVKIKYQEQVTKRFLLVIPYQVTEMHTLVGTIVDTTPDSVQIMPRYEETPRSFSVEQIEKAYYHRGRHRATWSGVKIGAGVGGTVAFFALMPDENRRDKPDIERMNDLRDRLRIGAYAIGLSTLVGGVIGYFSSTDVWEEMPIEVGPDTGVTGKPGVRFRWVVARF